MTSQKIGKYAKELGFKRERYKGDNCLVELTSEVLRRVAQSVGLDDGRLLEKEDRCTGLEE